MMALRLVGRPAAPVDLLLVHLAERIVRSDGVVWVEPMAGSADTLRRGLALAGLGTCNDEAPTPRPDLVPSLGSTLAPATEPAIEMVTLRRIELAESTVRLLGHRWLRIVWPAYRNARWSACRDVLREGDALAWWERRAWLAPGAIRLAAVRRSFRPIVFDRAALGSLRPAGPLHTRDAEITRWAFG